MAKKITYEKQTVDLYDRMADALESISGNYAGATLPEVTNDDNGDVLAVVSGAWAKSAAPSSLPAVTSDDNGDVLTVVEGAWAKAAPSGGSGILVIGMTEESGVYTLDKTWQEIHDATLAIIKDEYGTVMTLCYTESGEEGCEVDFWNAMQNATFGLFCASPDEYPSIDTN